MNPNFEFECHICGAVSSLENEHAYAITSEGPIDLCLECKKTEVKICPCCKSEVIFSDLVDGKCVFCERLPCKNLFIVKYKWGFGSPNTYIVEAPSEDAIRDVFSAAPVGVELFYVEPLEYDSPGIESFRCTECHSLYDFRIVRGGVLAPHSEECRCDD